MTWPAKTFGLAASFTASSGCMDIKVVIAFNEVNCCHNYYAQFLIQQYSESYTRSIARKSCCPLTALQESACRLFVAYHLYYLGASA